MHNIKYNITYKLFDLQIENQSAIQTQKNQLKTMGGTESESTQTPI